MSVGHVNYLLRKRVDAASWSSVLWGVRGNHGLVLPHSKRRIAGQCRSFFIEEAKQALGVAETVETCLEEACDRYQVAEPETPMRVPQSEPKTKRRLAEQEEALSNLRHKPAALRSSYDQAQAALVAEIKARRLELTGRQETGPTTWRCEQGLHRQERRLTDLTARFQRRQRRGLEEILRRRARRSELRREVTERQAAREANDTDSLCRERDLEKDQIMLDLQILLASLHDWARCHYFASEWQHLELNTAIEMVYRKPGRVKWGQEVIEVVLNPYCYADQQWAMEETCHRFNKAGVRWRDGRLLCIRVAREARFQLCSC